MIPEKEGYDKSRTIPKGGNYLRLLRWRGGRGGGKD